jgi:hypothetical protein
MSGGLAVTIELRQAVAYDDIVERANGNTEKWSDLGLEPIAIREGEIPCYADSI